MINILSTSAFHFLKFENIYFLITVCVALHVKCTLARHLSHTHVSVFGIIFGKTRMNSDEELCDFLASVSFPAK